MGDLSALVTGLLLAYNLPVTVPIWMPVIGAGLAIVLVKMIFGGLGANFVNPALAARAILMTSWVGYMSGTAYSTAVRGRQDAIASSTPLAMDGTYSLWQLFLGQCPGTIGEVSKLAILIGGIYLMLRKVISWRIPVTLLATVFLATWLNCGSAGEALMGFLSGGLFLGAFFMATDYATSPVTPVGRLIMGVGTGLLVFVIRTFSSMPEGVSYAILTMNLAVPLIDRFTQPRVYGGGKNMRETIHLAVRLMLFALVAAILLAVVNAVTAEPIARNDQAKVDAARAQVLEDYTFTELDGDLSEYSEILGVYRATEGDQTVGYVYELKSKGYGGQISLSVGIRDGAISGVRISTHSETKGLGTSAEAPFLEQFTGLPASEESALGVDAMSGATVSSNAVKTAVAQACRHAEEVLGLSIAKEGSV